jgi:hypothetical protein
MTLKCRALPQKDNRVDILHTIMDRRLSFARFGPSQPVPIRLWSATVLTLSGFLGRDDEFSLDLLVKDPSPIQAN